MTDSFEYLYDQIVQCERRIEEKTRLQNELRAQVEACKDTLQRIGEDENRLQKELSLKEEHMSAVELEIRILTTRENVLLAQRDSLLQEQASLQEQLTAVEEETEQEMVSFCQTVEDHSDDLDLSTSGNRARQNKASATVQRLQAREQALLTEIAEYEDQKVKVSQLETERCCQQQSLCDAAQTMKELEECLAEEQETLQQLKEEKQRTSKVPQYGEEFKRLRSELASLHTGSIEQECAHLQKQVKSLQQQLHSKQQKQLRQQQQLQQQQQQQQLEIICSNDAGGDSTDVMDSHSRRDNEDEGGVDGGENNDYLSRDAASIPHDVMDDDDDVDMTLPDLELSASEQQEAGMEGFRVVNRQKPVFKPVHC